MESENKIVWRNFRKMILIKRSWHQIVAGLGCRGRAFKICLICDRGARTTSFTHWDRRALITLVIKNGPVNFWISSLERILTCPVIRSFFGFRILHNSFIFAKSTSLLHSGCQIPCFTVISDLPTAIASKISKVI